MSGIGINPMPGKKDLVIIALNINLSSRKYIVLSGTNNIA